jgi:multidrug/hemolysin transport system ATP-binding protein
VKSLIKVENISRNYKAIKALDQVSFELFEGSFVSLLGPNGAGKSTLNNILSGLSEPNSGSIVYDGGETKKEDFIKYISMVFQHNVCDNLLTVKENLLVYGGLSIRDKDELSKRYEYLKDFLGFKDYENQKFKTLSGGQKRIVEISRALFIAPKVLILDEPTTGLDPRNRRAIWQIIDTIRKEGKTTIVLTTHYLEEASYSDQVIVINQGHITFQGTPSKFINEHSNSKVIIEPKDSNTLNEWLVKSNIKFEKVDLRFNILVSETSEVLKVIESNNTNIAFLQVQPGTLDDAYLNVIGESNV